MVPVAVAFRVGFHGFRTAYAAGLAKVLLPVPHQVTPHRSVNADLRKRLSQTLGQLCDLTGDGLLRCPVQQLLVVAPANIEKPAVTAANALGVRLENHIPRHS